MIGLGVYGSGGAIINEVRPLLSTAPVILLMDDALNDLPTYRSLAPQAFIVGRIHVPPEEQRRRLDSDPIGWGQGHAFRCHVRGSDVDAWQGFNETADTRDHCEDTATFDYAFARELKRLTGKPAVVGNFSVGTPHNNADIELWVPTFKEFGAILGYHGYAQGEGPYPSSLRSKIGVIGYEGLTRYDPLWFELRHRFLLAELAKHGVHPKVVINECGVRLAEYPVSPREINLELLASHVIYEPDVIGLCPFQWGHPYEFSTTHRLTKDHAELWAAWNRDHPRVTEPIITNPINEEDNMPNLTPEEETKALGYFDTLYDLTNDLDGFEQPSDSRIPAFSVVSLLESRASRMRDTILAFKRFLLPNR